MKYTINLIVVFDPEHRTLALNNNNQMTIELSKPSCRVLNEFIKNNGVNLSREMLLKNAWEDYGLTPSNASLNNYISELRKSFIGLGIDKPVIITLPRMGFRMEADIHPAPKHTTEISVKEGEIVTAKLENAVDFIKEDPPTTFSFSLPNKTIKKPIKWNHLTLFAGLCILGIVLLLQWIPSTQFKLMATYKKCDIYSIRQEPLPGFELSAINILEAEKVDCDHAKHDIFYTEERPDNDMFKITFLAACKKNQNESNYQLCRTFKVIE